MPEENRLSRILNGIAKQTDRELLQAIVTAAQARLEELEDRGPIHIVLHKEQWFAVQDMDDKARRKVTKLGPRLSPPAVMERLQTPPPLPLGFELSKDVARRRQQSDPQSVGWVDESYDHSQRRYFDKPAYDRALADYKEWKQHAHDPLAIAYGFTVEAMRIIQQLHDYGGYAVVYPNRESPTNLSAEQAANLIPHDGAGFVVGLPQPD